MTTNGHLLAERCERLLAAGLKRINVSLDSLDPAKFEKITRTRSYEKVMQGIDVVQKTRLAPVKVNAVLVRGLNDDEVEDFAGFARATRRGHAVHRVHAAGCGPALVAQPGCARGGSAGANSRQVAAGADSARNQARRRANIVSRMARPERSA